MDTLVLHRHNLGAEKAKYMADALRMNRVRWMLSSNFYPSSWSIDVDTYDNWFGYKPVRWWRCETFDRCTMHKSSELFNIIWHNANILIEVFRHWPLSSLGTTGSALRELNIWSIFSEWIKWEKQYRIIRCHRLYRYVYRPLRLFNLKNTI